MKPIPAPQRPDRRERARAARAAWLVWLGLGVSGSALAGPHAHEHGVMKLDVVLQGSTLQLELETPLDNLLGFERAPRTETERRAAAEVLRQIRNPGALIQPDAAGQCSLQSVEVTAPELEPGAKPAQKPAAGDGHAELRAEFRYACAQPKALQGLKLGLFEAFRRTQRIEVQMAAEQAQGRVVLRRPQGALSLPRR